MLIGIGREHSMASNLFSCLLPQSPPQPAKLRKICFEGGAQGVLPESAAARMERQRERDNERKRRQTVERGGKARGWK